MSHQCALDPVCGDNRFQDTPSLVDLKFSIKSEFCTTSKNVRRFCFEIYQVFIVLSGYIALIKKNSKIYNGKLIVPIENNSSSLAYIISSSSFVMPL